MIYHIEGWQNADAALICTVHHYQLGNGKSGAIDN